MTSLTDANYWIEGIGHTVQSLRTWELTGKDFPIFHRAVATHPPELALLEVPAIFKPSDAAAKRACERLVTLANLMINNSVRTLVHGSEKTPAWTTDALMGLAASRAVRSTVMTDCRLEGRDEPSNHRRTILSNADLPDLPCQCSSTVQHRQKRKVTSRRQEKEEGRVRQRLFHEWMVRILTAAPLIREGPKTVAESQTFQVINEKDPHHLLLEVLKRLPLRASGRDVIKGNSTTYGLSSGGRQDPRPRVTMVTKRHGQILRRVLQLLKALPDFPHDFSFTSLQAGHNTQVEDHIDDNNMYDSIQWAGGNFTGGRFCVNGVPKAAKYECIIFDGNVEHGVEPYEGDRYSLIAFTHWSADKANRDIVQELQSFGFPVTYSDTYVAEELLPIVGVPLPFPNVAVLSLIHI